MEIINYETAEINERLARVDTLESRVSGLTGLKFVNSTAEMTDTTRIYVNAADGNWYEYSGGSWVSRGQYGGAQIDAELKTAGAAADAKATGDLKSAVRPTLDGLFTDVANDKYAHGRYAAVNYAVTGNIVAFDGTASANARFKVSGPSFDRNASVQSTWREEQIGLVPGHEYIISAELISGTGDVIFVIYKDSGTGETLEVNSSTAEQSDIIHGDKFTASDTNARCFCVYIKKDVVYSEMKVRFSLLDVTSAYRIMREKVGLENLKNESITEMIDALQNRYAAIGAVDISADKGTITHGNLTVSANGNHFVLDGTTNSFVRVKITNGLVAASSAQSDWFSESLPVLDKNHEYVIAVSKLSGNVLSTTNCRVTFYNKDGTAGSTEASFTQSGVFAKGVAYSEPIKNIENIACLIIVLPNTTALENVALQINMIDLTVLKSLNENVAGKTLNDYYFENDYIDGRITDILDMRAAVSINSESFLWFTDPHYFYPETTVPENGMQSAQLAEYIKKRANNRLVICGGDFLRGYITKDDARKLLSDVREYLNPIYNDLFVCLGNHEYNNPGPKQSWVAEQLDSPELYSMFIKNQEYFFDSVSSKGDYAFTNRARQVKYFVIGTRAEKDIFNETIIWLANELLHVESGYHVIIISHIGLSYGTGVQQNQIHTKFEDTANLIDAVNGRAAFTFAGGTYSYENVGFEIVCAFTGHVHYDGSAYTAGGTPVIATTCDRAFVTDGDAGIKEVRKIGTIGEQALDYVLIDFDNHTIDLIRIGGSILGASYNNQTGKIYDTEVGAGTEYTGAEWVEYSPYKDRHFTYTGHID